jgi:glycosyltransferase involved in cell wall biosynthesis
MPRFDAARRAGFSRPSTLGIAGKGRGMRVLYFAGKECWPANTGAKLRNYYLARELSRTAGLTYLGFSDHYDGARIDKNGAEPAKFLPAIHADYPRSPDRFVEQTITVYRDPSYKFTNIVRGALGRTPLTVLNYTTRRMEQRLKVLLDENSFDIIQVEGLHLTGYLPIMQSAPNRPLLICDWHNVESELMLRYSEFAEGRARRSYARSTARKLQALERASMNRFDAHIVVSERDRARLLRMAPDARVIVIENGVDVEYYSAESIDRAYKAWAAERSALANWGQHSVTMGRNRILFVGSMDYHANIDAAIHFAREIWPSLLREGPELIFTIVGRSPSPEVRALAALDGVEVTGTVDDVRPYYREAAAAVVPLRVGGGSRLKILEAMAAGVPVVSTRLGAEGLDVRHGETIVLADAPAHFGAEVLDLCENTRQWYAISSNGRRLVSERYAWQHLGRSLAAFHRELAESARATANRGVGIVGAQASPVTV